MKYRGFTPEVFRDEANGLFYVQHHKKKLYFPRSYTSGQVAMMYRCLLIEQDASSPHCYIKSPEELKGRILLDVGAAEGILALDTIEQTLGVWLFECEAYWIEALQATFAPWKDKVRIIPEYVGDRTEGDCVTLDSLLEGKEETPYFLKMDIEGAEMSALRGAASFLERSTHMAVAICVYHKLTDEAEIPAYLEERGYHVHFPSDKYLFWDGSLRKVLVKGTKE